MNGIVPPRAPGIYKITCIPTKKIYIGSASDLRHRKNDHIRNLRQNKHANPKLQNAWNKYGEDAFIFEVLELVLLMSLTAREQYWFSKLSPFGRKGFNIATEAGSTLGVKRSPEYIEKMRQRKTSPETIEKLRIANLGRKDPPELVEKRRQANLGKKQPPEAIEKTRQANIGRKFSPEHREKLRQAKLGKKQSPEHVKKRNQPHIGSKRSPETRERMRQAQLGNQNRLGKGKSPEEIEKIRQYSIVKKMSPEAIENMRQAKRAYYAKKRQVDDATS
jgi:group I intron endonuclease